MQVRRAQARDAPIIEALYKVLVPGDGNIAVDPRRLAELESHADNYLFVVEVMGQVCGEQAARAARCTKLMLLSSRSRTDAHTFFSRMGFDGERKRGFVKYLNRVR